jgi:hypothetical protein
VAAAAKATTIMASVVTAKATAMAMAATTEVASWW